MPGLFVFGFVAKLGQEAGRGIPGREPCATEQADCQRKVGSGRADSCQKEKNILQHWSQNLSRSLLRWSKISLTGFHDSTKRTRESFLESTKYSRVLKGF